MNYFKLPKFHWAKILSVFFFMLLLGAYVNIFAIGIFAPGETLDPTCTPGSLDCTVNIGSGGSGWGLVGNSGTSIGIDFIGTTDDVDLQFRRNSIVAGQIGDSNTSFGLTALSSNTTGGANTANGVATLFSNTTGSQNTASGAGALTFNTTGSQNTANGFSALSGNTTGFANTASGDNSLSFNTTGNHNTANGAGALIFNTTGNFNTALGYAAGMYIANDIIGNSTSNNSVYLGYDTRASADGNNNEIVIGVNTIGNGSNTATIGNTSLLRTYLTGINLKAGSTTAGTAPLKFNNGTLLGTTEAGAIEYDGSHLYFTATDAGTRYQLDQQGGSGMIWPAGGAGIPNYSGSSSWGTSITDNSSNWNTSFSWGDHSTQGYVTGTPWTSMGYVTGTPWTGMGYITDGNTGWDNSYGFITSSNIKTINSTSLLGSGDIAINPSQWTTVGSGIYYNGGKVGLGTNTPSAKLEIKGTAITDGVSSDMGYNINPVLDPTTPTAITQPGSGLEIGDYWYSVTYYTNTGETHSAYLSTAITTTGGNQQVQLTIPVSSDPRVVGRKIYRTKVGQFDYQDYYLTTITNNTSTTYTDNTADISLTGLPSASYFRTNTTSEGLTINGVKSFILDEKMVSIGNGAGSSITTGGRNTLIGAFSGGFVTSGFDNTVSGYGINGITSGSNNTFVGSYAGSHTTQGGHNSAFGYTALANLNGISGTGFNTAMGSFAGLSITGNANTNVFIGSHSGYNVLQKVDASNSIAIGYQAYTNANNQIVLGNSSISQTLLNGKVGIGLGMSTPATATLHLSAGTTTAGTAPLKLTSGINLGTTEAGAIEYDGSHLYFTATNGGSRYQLDQQGGGTPAISVVNSSNLFSTGLTGTGGGVTTTVNSIFFGEYSGDNAINASNSIFIGNQAGGYSENATNSNFIGVGAGAGATDAANSNFIGNAAGTGASNSSNSNFIGIQSGLLATNAPNSNFIGSVSGYSATNASYSNFIGNFAGYSADNANNSIFIGQQSGNNDTVNNSGNIDDFSILIGKDTSTGGFSNSIAIGGSAVNTATNQFMIGSATRPINETRINGSGSTQCTITTGVGMACTSDERLKTNITDLPTDTLDKLTKIRTVNFNWSEGNNDTNNIGFLAQDLENYFPEVVSTDSEGYKSVYYSNMTPILVEAIRELDLKVKDFSSLDTSSATSLGSMIKQFIENEANRFEKIFAKTIVTEGIQMKDTITGEDYCVVIANGEFEKILGNCGEEVVQTEFEDEAEVEILEEISETDPVNNISSDEPDIEVIIEEVETEEIIETSSPILIEEVIDADIPLAPKETEIIAQ